MKILFSLIAVFFLGACQHAYTAESWEAEQVSTFKRYAALRQQSGREKLPWDNLFLQEPAAYAASEAAAGRYALYSIAMGYRAEEKDAQLMGVDCGSEKIETLPLVFGCMPPGAVFFKRIFEYNAAMLAQPGFPHAAACRIDKKFQAETPEWFGNTCEEYWEVAQGGKARL